MYIRYDREVGANIYYDCQVESNVHYVNEFGRMYTWELDWKITSVPWFGGSTEYTMVGRLDECILYGLEVGPINTIIGRMDRIYSMTGRSDRINIIIRFGRKYIIIRRLDRKYILKGKRNAG